MKNKTAIVTGSRQGIGKGVAIALAKEGYDIVISDIDQNDCEKIAGEIEKLGVKTLAVKCDVSKKAEVEELFRQTVEKFGRVDVLVNNAGIYPYSPFMEMKESDWDRVLDINLKSVFLCSQEAIKVMPKGGRIINVSSVASFIGFEGLVHYCASKGGVNSFIRALALELVAKEITVNAVAPGGIDTPGTRQATDGKARNQALAAIPLKRFGKPEDIANAVVFLASDKSSYITGQTIIVDGGWTLR